MTTTKNNEHKKLNFSSEREQSQVCLNSAEHEKNQGRKVLNVPNLRFPEFQGEWEKTKFGDIATGFDYGMNAAAKNYDGVNKYIRITDIDEASSTYTDKDIVSPDGVLTDNYLVNNRDILLARTGASTGKSYLYKKSDGKLYYAGFLIRANVTTHAPYFVFSQLHTHRYWRWVSIMSARSGQPGINSQEYSSFPIYTTSIKEESKIAKLLSLLDDRIATQNKIIDKLQSLIKGIVDCTILSKEKNAIVGDVCSISEQIRAEANIDDIITVRLHGNGVCKSSAENLQLGATQYYRRRAGQLIYGKQNFHNGAIGIVPISLDNGITSKDIPSFDIDEMKCNSVYLLAQLQSPQYYKPAEALTTGTGSKRLKEDTFLKMPIVLPNKREQDNIAVLIHRASMNLDHAKRLLELLSIQKQFLLRQMFI